MNSQIEHNIINYNIDESLSNKSLINKSKKRLSKEDISELNKKVVKLNDEETEINDKIGNKWIEIGKMQESISSLEAKIIRKNMIIETRNNYFSGELEEIYNEKYKKLESLQKQYTEISEKETEIHKLLEMTTKYSRLIQNLTDEIQIKKKVLAQKTASLTNKINEFNIILVMINENTHLCLQKENDNLHVQNLICEEKIRKIDRNMQKLKNRKEDEKKYENEIKIIPEGMKLFSVKNCTTNINSNKNDTINQQNEVDNVFLQYENIFETPKIVQYDVNFNYIAEYSCLASVKEKYNDILQISISCDSSNYLAYNSYWRYKTDLILPILVIDNHNFPEAQYYIDIYSTIIDVKNGLVIKPTIETYTHVSLITTKSLKLKLNLNYVMWKIFKGKVPNDCFIGHINDNILDNSLSNLTLFNYT